MDNPLYDKYAMEYAHQVENNIYNAYYERPSLISLLPDLHNKSILDMGCGSGEYVDYFLNKCAAMFLLLMPRRPWSI